jgi:hypothetical protein
MKSALKGTHLQSVKEGLLNRVSADDPQHCFDQWKIRMQQCIDTGGGGVRWKGWKLIGKILQITPISQQSRYLIPTPHMFKPCKTVNPRISTTKNSVA